MFDCLKCGGCCCGLRVTWRPHMKHFLRDFWDETSKGIEINIEGIESDADVCPHFTGFIGVSGLCGIYGSKERPEICGLFEPGSDLCVILRANYGKSCIPDQPEKFRDSRYLEFPIQTTMNYNTFGNIEDLIEMATYWEFM